MIGHSEKYGDAVYEKDGWLYYCRENLETDQIRFYLCPLGDREDRAGFTRAIGNILEDAHKYGKRARFETVTKSAADMLESCFPGRFDISPCRDFYEYIYSREKLVKLPGKKILLIGTGAKLFMEEVTPEDLVKYAEGFDEILPENVAAVSEKTVSEITAGARPEEASKVLLQKFPAAALMPVYLSKTQAERTAAEQGKDMKEIPIRYYSTNDQ